MVMMTSDYMIIVMVELTLKNGSKTYPYHVLWLILDYIIIVTVELALKNGYRTYPHNCYHG